MYINVYIKIVKILYARAREVIADYFVNSTSDNIVLRYTCYSLNFLVFNYNDILNAIKSVEKVGSIFNKWRHIHDTCITENSAYLAHS